MQALAAYNAAVAKHGTDREAIYHELRGDSPTVDVTFQDRSKIVSVRDEPGAFMVGHQGENPYLFRADSGGLKRLAKGANGLNFVQETIPHGQTATAQYIPPPEARRGQQKEAAAGLISGVKTRIGAVFGGTERHVTPEAEQRGVPKTMEEQEVPKARAAWWSRQFKPVEATADPEVSPPPQSLEESEAYRFAVNRPVSDHAVLERGEEGVDFYEGQALRKFSDGSVVHYQIGPGEGAEDKLHPVKAFGVIAPNLKGVAGAIHTYVRRHLETTTKPDPRGNIEIPTMVDHTMIKTGADGQEHQGEPVEHTIGEGGEYLAPKDGESVRTQFRRLQAMSVAGIDPDVAEKKWQATQPNARRKRARLRAGVKKLGEWGSEAAQLQAQIGAEVEEQVDVQKLKPTDVRQFVRDYQHLHPLNLSPEADEFFDPDATRKETKAPIPENRDEPWREALGNIYGAMLRLAQGPDPDAPHAYDRYSPEADVRQDAVQGLSELLTQMGTKYVPHSGVAWTNRTKNAVNRAEKQAQPKPPRPPRKPSGAPKWTQVGTDKPITIVGGTLHFRQRQGSRMENVQLPLVEGKHDAILGAKTLRELSAALDAHREETEVHRGRGGAVPTRAVVQLNDGQWVETHRSGASYPADDERGTRRNSRPSEVLWALHDVVNDQVITHMDDQGNPLPDVRLFSRSGAMKYAKANGAHHVMIPVVHPEFEDQDVPEERIAARSATLSSGRNVVSVARTAAPIGQSGRGRPMSGVVKGRYDPNRLVGAMPRWADHQTHIPRMIATNDAGQVVAKQVYWRGPEHVDAFEAVNRQMDLAEDAADEAWERQQAATQASTAAAAQEHARLIAEAANKSEPPRRPSFAGTFTRQQLGEGMRRTRGWSDELGIQYRHPVEVQRRYTGKPGFTPVP